MLKRKVSCTFKRKNIREIKERIYQNNPRPNLARSALQNTPHPSALWRTPSPLGEGQD